MWSETEVVFGGWFGCVGVGIKIKRARKRKHGCLFSRKKKGSARKNRKNDRMKKYRKKKISRRLERKLGEVLDLIGWATCDAQKCGYKRIWVREKKEEIGGVCEVIAGEGGRKGKKKNW